MKKNKKLSLLVRHLRPAASAFALGLAASLAATLLRTLFTQMIRFVVDDILVDVHLSGVPGVALANACVVCAVIALLEFGAGYIQDSSCAMRSTAISSICPTAGMCAIPRGILFSAVSRMWRLCVRLLPISCLIW